MKINHRPIYETARVEKFYSDKDGVPVKYVCTSALSDEARAMDIFYRETPHPEFGNRYFGLYYDTIRDHTMITNADKVESLEFGMIEVDGKYYYSQSHHDYKRIGNKMIDGGRVYIRSSGCDVVLRIIDGKFFAKDVEDLVELYYPGKCVQ